MVGVFKRFLRQEARVMVMDGAFETPVYPYQGCRWNETIARASAERKNL